MEKSYINGVKKICRCMMQKNGRKMWRCVSAFLAQSLVLPRKKNLKNFDLSIGQLFSCFMLRQCIPTYVYDVTLI